MKKPIVLKINPEKPDVTVLLEAANIIRKGGLVVYPTDTVYGLGANPLDEQAVLKVFQVKERSLDKPLPILISNINVATKLGYLDNRALKLIKVFWPGALTIIVEKKEVVPTILTGGRKGVGLRMPNYKITLELAKLSGGAIVGTSANKSGFKAARTANQALKILNGKVDLILDAGPSPGGVPSTIIDLTVDPPSILRLGPIYPDQIEEVLGEKVEVISKPSRAQRK